METAAYFGARDAADAAGPAIAAGPIAASSVDAAGTAGEAGAVGPSGAAGAGAASPTSAASAAGAASKPGLAAVAADEQLMLDVKRGSEFAFAELFRRYRQPIYGFFRRRLTDNVRAEDLAQETFLAVLKSARRYEARALFRTYVYGIAMNLLSAERRKTSREQGNKSAEPSVESDPATSLWVRRAVQQLDAEQREVLLLREFEQLSYEEIARLLKIPVNTVRSRLFRARLAVKELLVSDRKCKSK